MGCVKIPFFAGSVLIWKVFDKKNKRSSKNTLVKIL